MVSGYSPFAASNATDQMQICRNIVNGKLKFPSWVDPTCKDLIEKLLVRDPSKRLGNTNGGSRAIRSHKFFAASEWDQILRKKIKAPWIPIIKDAMDTSNFDPCDGEDEDMTYHDDGTNWDADF